VLSPVKFVIVVCATIVLRDVPIARCLYVNPTASSVISVKRSHVAEQTVVIRYCACAFSFFFFFFAIQKSLLPFKTSHKTIKIMKSVIHYGDGLGTALIF